MDFSAYRRLWANPVIRRTILVGFFGRAPWFGGGVILTLHIVNHLNMPYSAAGLVSAVFAIANGIASPWRGRMLDKKGLRRTFLPSLILMPPIFIISPFVSYWWLLAGMALAGVMAVPWFSTVRSVILSAVDPEDERAVMSLDGLFVEFAFMLGPAAGVVACVYWDTGLALMSFCLLSVVCAGWLYWMNPPMATSEPEIIRPRKQVRWVNMAVLIALASALAANFALAGTDLALVAVMKETNVEVLIGPAMIVWALGSLVGGLAYGAMQRAVPLWVLIVALSVTTVFIGLSPWVSLTFGLLFLAGMFCMPTITAGVEALNRSVPVSKRGEVMGWHGTACTVGSSMGPPVVGWCIDNIGAGPGFVISGLGGGLLFVALVAFTHMLRRWYRRRQISAGLDR